MKIFKKIYKINVDVKASKADGKNFVDRISF